MPKRIYHDVGEFNCGLARAYYNGKYGFIDTNGREVVKCAYDDVSNFQFGLANIYCFKQPSRSKSMRNCGIVDSTGKMVIPPIYVEVTANASNSDRSSWVKPAYYTVEDSNRKKGLYNVEGKMILPCIYDEVSSVNDGLVVVKQNNNYGIMNVAGRVVVPFKYSYIDQHNYSEGTFIFRPDSQRNYRYGLIDTNGGEIVPARFSDGDVKPVNEGLFAARPENKWGYFNRAGENVIPCIYDDAASFHKGFAVVSINEKVGLIDKQGKLKVPCAYRSRSYDTVNGGLIAFEDFNRKTGLVDTNNNIIVPFTYEAIRYFSEGMALVKRNGKFGYINRKGVEITPCIYADGTPFEHGVALVSEDDIDAPPVRIFTVDPHHITFDSLRIEIGFRSYFIDTNGKEVLAPDNRLPRYTLDTFKDGIALAKNGYSTWIYINQQGKEIINYKLKVARPFSEGRAAVKIDSQWFFIDKQGRQATIGFYDSATSFKNGIAVVKKGNKFGVIDSLGQIKLPFVYNKMEPFEDGLALVQTDTGWLFINLKGQMVFRTGQSSVSFRNGLCKIYDDHLTYYFDTSGKIVLKLDSSYYSAGPFYNGRTCIMHRDKFGWIDIAGKPVIPFTFDWAREFRNGMAIVTEHKGNVRMHGAIDFKGKQIIPFMYDEISDFSEDGMAYVKLNGRYGFINRQNQLVIPAVYDFCELMPQGKNALIPVYKNGQCGFIDKTGKRVLWFE